MKQNLILKSSLAILLMPLLIQTSAQSLPNEGIAKNTKEIPANSFSVAPKPAESNVASGTLANFKKEFGEISSVTWTINKEFSKAQFLYAETRVIAYFSPEGEFLASARNRFFTQTPLSVMNAVEKKYPGSIPYEVVEWNTPEGTMYVMLLETTKHKLKIKVYDSGSIEIIKKSKK